MDLLLTLLICLVNFMNIYDSFMNSYGYNHKKFIIYCGLVMDYFNFVLNDYDHYYKLVLTYYYEFY